MKKYYFILSVIISLGILYGCNNLDYNEISVYDDEWVFNNEGEVSGMLGVVYAHVRHDMGDSYSGAMLASATDESDFTYSLSSIHRYYNGAWSSVNAFSDTWVNSFSAIYSANNFLEKLDKVFETLELYQHNVNQRPYVQMKRRFEMFPYQARFLRAYFHFELAKTYGDVPLVTRTLTPAEANELTRTPVQEVFRFIVDECNAIMEYLPITYAEETGSHIGRINRPTVLALKARTLLYAASPLFNPENPREAWRKAAIACKELIDYAPYWEITLSPLDEYDNLWGSRNHYEVPEIIWFRYAGNTSVYARYNYPVGFENTIGGNCPSQNLVDAYEYNNSAPAALRGRTWPQAEAASILPDNPYENLDPRFAMTVARNGDTWPLVAPYNERPLETFEGGRNAAPIVNATKTGYYLKKYVNGTNRVVNPTSPSQYSWIVYRLSEFYLNYAEAMFNYMDGDATATSDGILNMSANDAVNVLRERVNMPLFGAETNGEVWKERYKRERMVELAFEGHRFWDVRRWKTGAESFMQIKTITVNRTLVPGTDDQYNYAYTRGPVINRGQWQDKYYLYPIPFSELRKAEGLTQNDGWQ